MAASRAESGRAGRAAAAAILATALLSALSGARAAPAADPAPTPAPAVGPAPGIPAGLFTMAPAAPCTEQLCFTTNSDQPGVPSLTASRTHMVMINPDIVDTTRGVSHITADRAEETGADIGNSQIVLTGNVHAEMAQGELSAASATIQVVDKRIASIVAQGSPAQFLRFGHPAAAPAGARQGGPNAALANTAVHGHADSITYDLQAGSVQLNGNSWLTDGCNEFTSQRITYDLMTQTVQAGPEPGNRSRVHGTIRNTHPGTSCTNTAGKS